MLNKLQDLISRFPSINCQEIKNSLRDISKSSMDQRKQTVKRCPHNRIKHIWSIILHFTLTSFYFAPTTHYYIKNLLALCVPLPLPLNKKLVAIAKEVPSVFTTDSATPVCPAKERYSNICYWALIIEYCTCYIYDYMCYLYIIYRGYVSIHVKNIDALVVKREERETTFCLTCKQMLPRLIRRILIMS